MRMIDFEGARWEPGIPLLETTDGRAINHGQWYGYPACCHNYFWFQRKLLLGEKTAEELALGFLGTGYRPCPDCQKLTAAEIYRGICERRWSDLPFPIQGEDFDAGVMHPRLHETLFKFAEAMKSQGVVLDPKLEVIIEQQGRLVKDTDDA